MGRTNTQANYFAYGRLKLVGIFTDSQSDSNRPKAEGIGASVELRGSRRFEGATAGMKLEQKA